MKDFGSSRNLPIVSQSGTPGFASKPKVPSSSNLSDDVARGGHAAVKVASEEETVTVTKTSEHTDNVEAMASHVTATSATPAAADAHLGEVKSINIDLPTENVKGRKTKDTSSAAKIARKLKVS